MLCKADESGTLPVSFAVIHPWILNKYMLNEYIEKNWIYSIMSLLFYFSLLFPYLLVFYFIVLYIILKSIPDQKDKENNCWNFR